MCLSLSCIKGGHASMKQVSGFMIIPDRSEDFAEAFRNYVLTMTSWPPSGKWNCSSQDCACAIDIKRYNYLEGYRVTPH
jgi:hypothetical protein